MYRMYYSGYDGSYFRIGMALSKDGIQFEKYYNNPVLNLGTSWDNRHVSEPYVLHINNQYYIYYSGHDGAHYRIGLALSKDGIHFEKYHDNPILNLGPDGSWDDYHVNKACVLHINNQYYMYYSGYDGAHYRIGLALSKDGIHFEKYHDNPILNLGPDGSWDDYHVDYTCVIYINNQWWMYYAGYDGAHYHIGVAFSKDGIHFEKYHDNPILNLGTNGSWDDNNINHPNMIHIDNQWRLYYTGNDTTYSRTGVAFSKDGIHFEKYHDNPILDLGPGGSWDDGRVYQPCVIKV